MDTAGGPLVSDFLERKIAALPKVNINELRVKMAIQAETAPASTHSQAVDGAFAGLQTPGTGLWRPQT